MPPATTESVTMETTVTVGRLQANISDADRTIEECLAECDRELHVRVRCFGDWVDKGKLSSLDAKDRLERLATACRMLAMLADLTPDEFNTLRKTVAAKPKPTPSVST